MAEDKSTIAEGFRQIFGVPESVSPPVMELDVIDDKDKNM
jgi:hypothetical protein